MQRSKFVVNRRTSSSHEKTYSVTSVWTNPQLIKGTNDVRGTSARNNSGGSKYWGNNTTSVAGVAVQHLANGLLKKKKQLLNEYLITMKSASGIVERFKESHPQHIKTRETLDILQVRIDKLRKEIEEDEKQTAAKMGKSDTKVLSPAIENMLDELEDNIPSALPAARSTVIDQKPNLKFNLKQIRPHVDDTPKLIENSKNIENIVTIDLTE